MKILHHNSILKYLPINLNKKQFLIFDAIRFSLEIVENSWSSLINQIEFIASSKSEYVKDLPKLFVEIWSIIDNVKRFISLHSQLEIKSQLNIMDTIEHVVEFRHTLQHLDERIGQTLIDSDIPVYGILTWNYLNPETDKVDVLIASSGIARYKHKFNYDVTKFDKNKSVDYIVFESVIRKSKNQFERAKLDLSLLISNLKNVVEKVEKDLDIQFAKHNAQRADWKRRKDILIRINNN